MLCRVVHFQLFSPAHRLWLKLAKCCSFVVKSKETRPLFTRIVSNSPCSWSLLPFRAPALVLRRSLNAFQCTFGVFCPVGATSPNVTRSPLVSDFNSQNKHTTRPSAARRVPSRRLGNNGSRYYVCPIPNEFSAVLVPKEVILSRLEFLCSAFSFANCRLTHFLTENWRGIWCPSL